MISITFDRPYMNFETEAAQRGDFGPLPENKSFKKGERVLIFKQTMKGTFEIQRATVRCCGKKNMQLILDVPRHWLECNHRPSGDDPRWLLNGYISPIVMPSVSDERAEEILLNIAKARRAYLKQQHSLFLEKGEKWAAASVKDALERLEEPTITWDRA